MAKGMTMMSLHGTFMTFLVLGFLLHRHQCSAVDLKPCGFNAIYNFGDSLSDAGNAEMEFPDPTGWGFPLGVTTGGPTGRFSDGLLIIDRIAESAGLPFANPYLKKNLDHSKGVNFAVGGTGLLSEELRRKWNVTFKYSQSSIDVQLRWYDEHLAKTFKDEAARKESLKHSLFVIGGGGNDYANLHGTPPELGIVEAKKLLMPDMMTCLSDAIKKFIRDGATKIVVTGINQGGCGPYNYQPDNKLHCDPVANEYHEIHNQVVQKEIQQLSKEFPNVLIVYGDLWAATQWIWDRYQSLGFVYPQKPCCGGDGKYCGFPGAPYLGNPKEFVFWDTAGHFTDASYRYMSQQVIPQIYSGLKCDVKIEL